MHVFDENGCIVKKHSAEEIVYDFYKIRTKFHIARKKNQEDILYKQLKILESKTKFIKDIINDKLTVDNKRLIKKNNKLIKKQTNTEEIPVRNITNYKNRL